MSRAKHFFPRRANGQRALLAIVLLAIVAGCDRVPQLAISNENRLRPAADQAQPPLRDHAPTAPGPQTRLMSRPPTNQTAQLTSNPRNEGLTPPKPHETTPKRTQKDEARPPSFIVGLVRVEVSGRRSRDEIRQDLRRLIPSIRGCAKSLTHDYRSDLSFRYTILPEGRTTKLSATAALDRVPMIERCVLELIRSVRHKKDLTAGVVQVFTKLVLSGQGYTAHSLRKHRHSSRSVFRDVIVTTKEGRRYRVTLDTTMATMWVVLTNRTLFDVYRTFFPTVASARGQQGFVSADLLASKAMAFDERLVATVRHALRHPQGLPRSAKKLFVELSKSFDGWRLRGTIAPKIVGLAKEQRLLPRQDREIKRAPELDSSWSGHWSSTLEPLLRPIETAEGKRLLLGDRYQVALRNTFVWLSGLGRQTPIGLLELLGVGRLLPDLSGNELWIRPTLSIEPLATYYLRRARAYRYLRKRILAAVGPSKVKALRPLSSGGKTRRALDVELRSMEALFYGAYLVVCDELKLSPEHDPDLGEPDAASNRRAYRTLVANLANDDDLKRDVRRMIPLRRTKTGGYDVQVVLGVQRAPMAAEYDTRPKLVRIVDLRDNRIVEPSTLTIIWARKDVQRPTLLVARTTVKTLLDRAAFRKHCDRYRSFSAIMQNLH